MAESSPAITENARPDQIKIHAPALPPSPEVGESHSLQAKAPASPWMEDMEAQNAQLANTPDQALAQASRSGIKNWAKNFANIFLTRNAASQTEATSTIPSASSSDSTNSEVKSASHTASNELRVEVSEVVTPTMAADNGLKKLKDDLLFYRMNAISGAVGSGIFVNGLFFSLIHGDWNAAATYGLTTAIFAGGTKMLALKADRTEEQIKSAKLETNI